MKPKFDKLLGKVREADLDLTGFPDNYLVRIASGEFAASAVYQDPSNSYLGVQTVKPRYPFQIGKFSSSDSAPWWYSSAGIYKLALVDQSSTGLLLYGNNQAIIGYSTSGQSSYGQIKWVATTGKMSFVNSGNEFMTVASSGNVGINKISPETTLDVAGRFRSTGYGSNPTSGAGLEIGYNPGVPQGFLLAYDRSSLTYKRIAYDGLEHLFRANGLDRVFINSSGSVGIGTTTPLARLHISDGSSGVTPLDWANTVFIENSYGDGMTFAAPDDAGTNLFFGFPSDPDYAGFTAYGPAHASRAGYFDIRSGGAVRMSISSSGSVGIGTISPTALLHVSGAEGTPSVANDLLKVSANSGTGTGLHVGVSETDGYVWIEASAEGYSHNRDIVINSLGGNVGIGTTSPTAKLHVYGSSSIKLQNPNTDQMYIAFLPQSIGSAWYIGVDGGDYFKIADDYGFSTGTKFVIDYAGNVGIGTTNPVAKLEINDNGGPSPIVKINADDNAPWALQFHNKLATQDYAFFLDSSNKLRLGIPGVTSNVMTWNGNGNVGIGTTSPAAKLEVSGSGYLGGGVVIERTDTASKWGISGVSGGGFQIYDRNSGNATRFVIDSSGNVGIGTTSPTGKFHVSTSGGLTAVVISDTSSNVGGFGVDQKLYRTITADGAYYSRGLSFVAEKAVASGITDSGYITGFWGQAFAGNYAGTHEGTLDKIFGGVVYTGIYGDNNTGTVNTVYGLQSVVYASSGTIGTAYNLYLGTTYGTGTINNLFAIYQTDSNATNYFAGSVGVGTDAPTSKLDINGDRIRVRNSFTPTSTSDTSGNVGDITWDDNFLYIKTNVGWRRVALSDF